MNNLFNSSDIDPTNMAFGAFILAGVMAAERDAVKNAINSTECQFSAEILPRSIRVTNEESGEVFGFSIDSFCVFCVNNKVVECEIAFDLWLGNSIEDCELDQWAEAFLLAEDAIEAFRAGYGYNYKKAYKYIKRVPVERPAQPAPFPAEAPEFVEGERNEDGETNEIPMFI